MTPPARTPSASALPAGRSPGIGRGARPCVPLPAATTLRERVRSARRETRCKESLARHLPSFAAAFAFRVEDLRQLLAPAAELPRDRLQRSPEQPADLLERHAFQVVEDDG